MRRPRLRLLLAVLVLPAIFLIAGVAVAAWLPDPYQTFRKAPTPSTLITDRYGRILYEAIDPLGNKNIPLPLSAFPRPCQEATIATEDERFYSHPGFDPLAIARAAWSNLRAGHTVSGASTLTQQLARNLLIPESERYEQSLARKLREAWLAWRLERKHSKDELLALYLNTTYYGHYATGLESAARAYFGASAAELDLAQCALLAGLPQWPAGYNPIENPDPARRRQASVLRLMTEQGYISPDQATAASKEGLRFASTPFPIEAPHFVMAVQSQLESILPVETIAAGGLRVVTTLDSDWQTAGQEAVRRRLAQLRSCATVEEGLPGVTCDADSDPSRRVENAALIALEPSSGAIRAMIGSPDYFDVATSGAVNAVLAQRQPGSAIKPLTYALALDPEAARRAARAPWTPATIVPDVRTSFSTAEGTPYVPNNYDRRYHGPVTLRTALANSYNIPAVVALNHVGVDRLIEFARDLGIPWSSNVAPASSSPPSDAPNSETASEQPVLYGLSLTLGGGEVRLIDLAAAYGAFANGGFRVQPYSIERIETLDGTLVWSHEAAQDGVATPSTRGGERVLDERVAFLITDILSDELARRPAFGQGSALDIGRPAAAKTGTTTDWRDNWTLGYTAEVVTGVWVGNVDNTPMKDVSGITGAGPIWHDFMTAVLRDRPESGFTPPPGLVQVEICADSGLPPGQFPAPSPESGAHLVTCPQRRLEWFIDGTVPDSHDQEHVQLLMDPRTGQAAGPEVSDARPQVFWVLGPEYQAWARENHFPQPPLVPGGNRAAPVSSQLDAGHGGLWLVSPDPNRRFRIDPALPQAVQQIAVSAFLTLADVNEVTLAVDGEPFAVVTGPELLAWWQLERGRHAFAAWATTQDGTIVRSEEVVITVE